MLRREVDLGQSFLLQSNVIVGKPVYFRILTRLAHDIFKDAVSDYHQSSSVVAKQLVSSRGE